jgi:RNA polymerase sigma factor (TIGR02999 family)
VHEAYLKLVRYQDVRWRGQSHFFGAVIQTMRRLLIDHARAASALKRKGTHVQLTQEVANIQDPGAPDLFTEWTDLLNCLAKEHPRGTKVVECRCVQGLTIQETADVLGVSHCTVSMDWRRAQAWLGRELGLPSGANGHVPLLPMVASTVKP